MWVEFVVGFLWVLRFSSLLKNQHFQIPILALKVSPISARGLDTFDTQIKGIIIIIIILIIIKKPYLLVSWLLATRSGPITLQLYRLTR